MINLFKSKTAVKQSKILIVDDEPDLLSNLRCRLEVNKYNVSIATNGQDGLDKAMEEKPDVILLDNNMPIMTGPEMLKRLKQNPQTKDIPVIMLTALCDQSDIAEVSALGIKDYITKPFDYVTLMEKIANVINE